MKIALCAVLLLAAQLAGIAAESGGATAYTALRLVGKQAGEDALNRVVEVRGRYGAPEPEVWKVTLDEPSARGGLRELDVEHGKITGEKTPVARQVSGKINFNQLNLDSEGVFTVVNGEMEKAGIMFSRADYLLKSNSAKGDPVWHIDVFNGAGSRVGAFEVAADSGKILEQNLQPKPVKSAPGASDHDYVQATPPTPPRGVPPPPPDATVRRLPSSDDGYIPPPPGAVDDRHVPPPPRYAGRSVDDDDDDDLPPDHRPFPQRVEQKVEHHFEKRARQFKNFFTGRGWTDQ